MEKPDLFWVQDSGGTHSCHVNDGSTFVRSLIGSLHLRNNTWHVILKDSREISPKEGLSFSRAMLLMEDFYRNGIKVPQENKQTVKTPTSNRHTPREAQAGKI